MFAGLRPSRSLTARLTITYALALAVGLIVFAGLSLASIDEVLKSTLDSRLGVAARAFVASLTIEDGKVRSDFATRARLRRILSPQQNGAIFGAHGQIIMQSGVAPPGAREVPPGMPDTPTYMTIPGNGVPVRVVVAMVPDAPQTTVVLWRPIDFIADYKRIASITFGVAILVIVTIAIWIGGFVTRRGLAPLRNIALVASEIEARDLTSRLPVEGEDELGQLSAAFNRMLDRLALAFAQQRRFMTDASHELRAPLAIIRTELDLVLRRQRDPAEYRAAIESIRTEIAHLDALIDVLLLMARSEEGLSTMREVDVAQFARSAIRRMERFANAKGIAITEHIPEGVVGFAEPEVLERILVSLLHNAIKFGRDRGAIDIVVEQQGDALNIAVRDDGPGFSSEAQAHAFDRFWRDESVGTAGGSGLGLAIAKSAIERWGGRIALCNRTDGGGEISITLPASAV